VQKIWFSEEFENFREIASSECSAGGIGEEDRWLMVSHLIAPTAFRPSFSMKVFTMKPVTAHDVARLSEGLVMDADEQDRIFDAIDADPDLERLYMRLTEDLEDELRESPERPALLADAREYQSLLARSRMCGLNRGLPLSSYAGSVPVSMSFLWRGDREPATCTFVPIEDRPGVWRLSTSLPAHVRVLGVVAAVCRFADSDDLTRRKVHADWSLREQAAVAEEAGKMVRIAGSPKELAAEAAVKTTEHRGETLNLDVGDKKPWSAGVIRSKPANSTDERPFPVLLTAFDGARRAVASEARLMYDTAETFVDLFPGCVSSVASLEVRPLPLRQLCRLGSRESALLIGSTPHSVRMASGDLKCPGDYIVNLADDEVRAHLDHTDSVLCLQLVELDGEVQS
jgi:hypothetical protein